MTFILSQNSRDFKTDDNELLEQLRNSCNYVAKLELSEEKYRTLIDKANDVIFVHELVNGIPSRLIEVNEVACQLLGYSKEELFLMTPIDLVSESRLNNKDLAEVIQKLVAQKKVSFHIDYRTKDGREIPFEVNCHMISLQGKEIVLAVNRDISERRQVESKVKKLNESLEKMVQERTTELRAAYKELEQKNKELIKREKDLVSATNRISNILESITDGFFALDNDWRFMYVNSEAEKQLNKNKEELLGSNFSDIFSDPTELETYYQDYVRAIEDKRNTQFEIYYEPTQQWFEVRAYPSPEGLSVFFKDISQRKQHEEMLAKSRDFYLTLFEEFPALIWRSGLDTKGDYFNKTWLQFTGRTMEQELGDGWVEGIHPEDLGRCMKAYHNAFNSREPFEINYRLRRYDGEYRWIIDRGRPYYDLNNKFAGFIGSCDDITEQKLTEEALKKSGERYRSLVQQSSEGIFVFDLTTRKIQEVNQAMINLLGYSENEFKGMYYDEIVNADSNSITTNVDRVLKGETIYFSREYKRKGGAMINVDIIASLIIYDQSKVCLVNVRDVSERKHAEEKLNKSYQNLELTLTETVNALITVSEKRDPYTAGHQHRVAELACTIAREMNLSEQQIKGILIAGKLHDIGKIYVPTDILNKPGKLSEIEMAFIKTHPQVGHDILCKIPFEYPVAEIVAQHHERIDGSGYPKGLIGEEIMLEARILAVADVLEAMASHRPYRPAVGLQKALEELEQNMDKYYDPLVVKTLLNLIYYKRFALEKVFKENDI